MNYIYDKMDSIVLQNGNNNYEFKFVTDFYEYDHEIVITSAVQIDGLVRGFVGNLIYVANGSAFEDEHKKVTSTITFKDVLLARIIVSANPGNPIEWRYTFLKD